MKTCHECHKSEPEVEFTSSRKYNCKDCVKKRNQKISLKKGCKLKFIPIITNTQKQCGKCKELKDLEHFSNAKRGRLGKSTYCKPCFSKIQLTRLTKEERKQNTQKYRDNNRKWWRFLHRINQFNRKNQLKLTSDNTVTKEFIEYIYSIENCYYCKDFIDKKYRTLEHKLPLNRGGQHTVDNITMACLKCNCTKRDMTEIEFNKYKINKND